MSRTASSRKPIDLASLRSKAREILLDKGTALDPHAHVPEQVDDLIGALADADPSLDRRSVSLVRQVETAVSYDLASKLSDQFGSIMATYGDAGYHVGIATGLELAALIFGSLLEAPGRSRRVGRKGGAR